MSKSLGNFFTLRDLMAKGFTGREVRYLLLTAHYRETFNFTLDGLNGAKTALARIDECIGKLHGFPDASPIAPSMPPVLTQFKEALDDDLNISAAWAAVFEWIRETNKRLAANQISPEEANVLILAWQKMNSVLGLHSSHEIELAEKLDATLQKLLEDREAARKAKDFKRADALRDELKSKGWVIEDSPKGIKLKKM